MAISLVGTPQFGTAVSGNSVTLTFDVAPQQNDVVILIGGDKSLTTIGPTTAGYTTIGTSPSNIGLGAWYKVMGATPDTTVVGKGDANSADAGAYCSYVLRGVDAAVLDAAVVTANGNVEPITPGSITTATGGAWVVQAAALTNVNTITAAPTGYSNKVAGIALDTNRYNLGAATKLVASAGVEAAGQWTTEDDTASTPWSAITIAIKPAGVSTTVPGAPTGVAATAGDAQATVTWAAPASDGGATITGYTVTGTPGGTVTVGGSTLTATVTGLTNGTAYTFTVHATNSVGNSAESAASSSVTPAAANPMHHNGGVLSIHHNGGLITMHLPLDLAAAQQYPSYQTAY